MNRLRCLSRICSFIKYIQNLDDLIENSEELIENRENIRLKVTELQNILIEETGEQNSYYIMFALVAFADEKINNSYEFSETGWLKLQKEFYDTDEGGDKFYTLLDDVIRDPSFPKVVHITYLLILNCNFQGKLKEHSDKTGEAYIRKLKKIINSNVPIRKKTRNIKLKDTANIKGLLLKYSFVLCIITLTAVYVLNCFALSN